MTTEKRLDIYKKVYRYLRDQPYPFAGICTTLAYIDFTNIYPSTDELLHSFPEFELFLPRNGIYCFWFARTEEGRMQRLTVLSFCIAMCEREILNSK